jgi:hypothetical protein
MATEAFTLRAETDIVHKLDDLAGLPDCWIDHGIMNIWKLIPGKLRKSPKA